MSLIARQSAVKAFFVGAIALYLLSPVHSRAQFQTNTYALTPTERAAITTARDHLRETVAALRKQVAAKGKTNSSSLPDIEIFLDAVDRNLAQNLFFSKQNLEQAFACLKEGETRAAALGSGRKPWLRQTGTIVLGYRSKIDGSAQPYQMYIPPDYDFDSTSKHRLDMFLHGRGGNLNEINFIRSTGWVKGDFGTATPPNLALAPYGRGNNGWRYCGEVDVFEALTDCRSRFRIDADQITLRGFSMGGHGVFHIGLHNPGTWAVISPGAGFVDTKHYLELVAPMPDWQDSLFHLYDAVDVAANAKNVPMISYVGELDSKYPQYRLMAEALKRENAPFEEIIAAKTEHRYEPKSLQSILNKMAAARREPNSDIHFVTYTLRYAQCKWATIEALERHWMGAEVNASKADGVVTASTRNVGAISFAPSASGTAPIRTIRIDGQIVQIPEESGSSSVTLTKRSGRWRIGTEKGLHKRPGLQGPIDDALFDRLIVVTGTGTPWNRDADKWSQLELERFRSCWSRYFRATLPEITDKAVSSEDLDGNLYLFGDPGSNAVLRRILPKLPLRWTRDTITIKGKTFSAKDHLPLLIFPNPESPKHYVVIDTGMTFSRDDQEGSNALQYPHLPDYAVIRIDASNFSDDRTKDVEFAGFFDENWR